MIQFRRSRVTFVDVVVALDGTVFHKTGMIIGGQAVDHSKRWEQREIKGSPSRLELNPAREKLVTDITEISKMNRKVMHDDQLVSKIVGNENRVKLFKEELSKTCTSKKSSNVISRNWYLKWKILAPNLRVRDKLGEVGKNEATNSQTSQRHFPKDQERTK